MLKCLNAKMFPAKNRLTQKKDLERVFKRGYRSFSRDLGLKFVGNGLDHSRFTVIVSNKISKKAVERNQIKRRLREILRLAAPNLVQNLDLVILTKDSVKNLDYQGLEEQVRYCLNRAKLTASQAQDTRYKKQVPNKFQIPISKDQKV